MLRQKLNNVTGSVAANIVAYRDKNPFNTIEEIKYVDGFTRDMFLENKNIMVVCTNLRDADEEELFTLGTITEDEIDDIIDYRKKHTITSISEIEDEKLISKNRFDKVKKFIAVRDKEEIDAIENEYVANVNTAAYSHFINTGLSSGDTNKIIEYRLKNGYSYKTLMELSKIPGIGLSESEVNRFEDNLTIKTDINNACDNELKTLVGDIYKKVVYHRSYSDISDLCDIVGLTKYEKIKNFIYTGTENPKYVNLNTATVAQMTEMGFSSADATKIANHKEKMKCSKDIPVDISSNDKNASLYTNINTATVKELESLNHGITSSLINEIISYREEQFFGTKDEIKQFFNDRNAYGVYANIGEFLVVR